MARQARIDLAGGGDKPPAALQGYVEGEYVRIAAPFAGTLVKLETQRGKDVEPGAPLFALEAENEDAARREAEERVRRVARHDQNLGAGAFEAARHFFEDRRGGGATARDRVVAVRHRRVAVDDEADVVLIALGVRCFERAGEEVERCGRAHAAEYADVFGRAAHSFCRID